MDNSIVLSIGPTGWNAEYFGPHRAEIEDLFGSNTIPTAFMAQASWRPVQAEIERLNPGVAVRVAITSLNSD
jgi:hypothetical protein